jgi:Tfp pilus assembly protein PilF
VNLARAWRAQGRTGEARAELERALEDDPGMAPAHGELGLLLSSLGDDAAALVHLRRAVELAPGDPALRNVLAWVLATSRTQARPEEALAIAQRLCEQARYAQAGFLESLAAALARLGRFDEAVERQTRALERVPAEHRARLAEVLELYRSKKPFLKSP